MQSCCHLLITALQELKCSKFEEIVQQTGSLAQQLMSLKQGADSRQVMCCCLTCTCFVQFPLGYHLCMCYAIKA